MKNQRESTQTDELQKFLIEFVETLSIGEDAELVIVPSKHPDGWGYDRFHTSEIERLRKSFKIAELGVGEIRTASHEMHAILDIIVHNMEFLLKLKEFYRTLGISNITIHLYDKSSKKITNSTNVE